MEGKILVVDDEMHLAKIIQFTLKHAGYDVYLAYDGREALEKVNEVRPELVILDLMLPLVDGYKVCNTIKQSEETSEIPVIILTARDLSSLELEEPILADRFMQKPFNTEKLIETIEDLLQGDGRSK
ncbi:two-component system response regulator [bacterium]|nr:MAG: two-component system response regulator [bacterium]